jgi:hypothetical protein
VVPPRRLGELARYGMTDLAPGAIRELRDHAAGDEDDE